MSQTLEVRRPTVANDSQEEAERSQSSSRPALQVIDPGVASPGKSIREVFEEMTAAVAVDSAAAQASYQVDNHLVGATEVHVRAGGHRFVIDEPAALGGTDRAPNPIEYALASLGSCQAITYRFWSEKLGIAFDRLCIEVDGDIDFRGLLGLSDEVRPGFETVRISVRISGPASQEAYERLHGEVERHCPMLDVFRNRVGASIRLHTS